MYACRVSDKEIAVSSPTVTEFIAIGPTENADAEESENPVVSPATPCKDVPTEEPEPTFIPTPTASPTVPPTSVPEQTPTPAPTNTPVPETKELFRRETDSSASKTVDYIYFGSYPQSQVKNDGLIKALNELAGSTSSWISYGYYNTGASSDFMKYTDVICEGNKYRGVYIKDYRPGLTLIPPDPYSQTVQEKMGYKSGGVYWFKYEPIKWALLSETSGNALLISSLALDGQDYHHFWSYESQSEISANNYKESSIREWLNSTFYDTAFTDEEKELIKVTQIDNSASSTGLPQNINACEDTYDKIFIASVYEYDSIIKNFLDGLPYTGCSDYAFSQGLGMLFSVRWLLRSPDTVDFGAYCVSRSRTVEATEIYNTNIGILPLLNLTL